jgi:hypothetical protein
MKELLAALELDTIPQVSLGTAALLIFAACSVLAVVRGFLRLLTGSLILCVSGFAGYLSWRHLPPGSAGHLPWLPIIVPALVGSVVFFVLRRILRFATRPFGRTADDGPEPRRSVMRRVLTLLFSVIPTSLLWFTGAAAVRNVGSVAEIRRFVDGPDAQARSVFMAELKNAIDRAVPSDWFGKIDPLADEARVTLAKLIALGDSGPPPKAIPVMEEPEIKALVSGDPKLRALAEAGRYAEILRDPRLDNVVANPDLRKLLADLRL